MTCKTMLFLVLTLTLVRRFHGIRARSAWARSAFSRPPMPDLSGLGPCQLGPTSRVAQGKGLAMHQTARSVDEEKLLRLAYKQRMPRGAALPSRDVPRRTAWLGSAVSAGLAGLLANGTSASARGGADIDFRLPTGGASKAKAEPDAMKMEMQPGVQKGDLQDKGGKRRKRFPDFQLTPSGLQVKDLRPGKTDGLSPGVGDTVVLAWEGYTINYFGRPFETRTLQQQSKIQVEPFRFKVGDGTVIPAIDEAVRSMQEGGIRQMIIPVELGYDEAKRLEPRPSTFSGQRALDFVMDNKGGLIDKTLLMNIEMKKVYASR